jgi:transcriptional regulator with XRE-family HTH domain
VEHGRQWARELSALIGARVAHYRRQAGLSAQALAARCDELGLPSLSRVVITKLENGRREAVSVSELIILARALRVSAADLVFPLGQAETAEAFPGHEIDTWKAVLVFAGIAQRPGRPAPAYENGVTWLYQVHYQLVDDWALAAESHRRTIVTGLRGIRSDLAERGLLLPPLPEDIAAAVNGEAAK